MDHRLIDLLDGSDTTIPPEEIQAIALAEIARQLEYFVILVEEMHHRELAKG